MDCIKMIKEWDTTMGKHIDDVSNIIKITHQISKEYSFAKENISHIGFNIFSIVSELYYRENFHSDIIKAFLDPNESHNQKNFYLNNFIDLINSLGANVSKGDFLSARVRRETSNIDVLISDELSKKAIIIENKINNAVDMERQLPRYLETIEREYEVVSIVYLTLDSSKQPDKANWTEDDITNVEMVLTIIPAYDKENKSNIYDGWIIPSLVENNNIDCISLLRQYGKLIKFLNSNIMDIIALDKFYEIIKTDENLQTCISIRNMLNDLPTYLATKIVNKYKTNYYPFEKIGLNRENDTVFERYKIDKYILKMDIWCSESGYTFEFWCESKEYDIKQSLSNLKFLENFQYKNEMKNIVTSNLGLVDDENLFKFIDNILKDLREFRQKTKQPPTKKRL